MMIVSRITSYLNVFTFANDTHMYIYNKLFLIDSPITFITTNDHSNFLYLVKG